MEERAVDFAREELKEVGDRRKSSDQDFASCKV